MADGRRKPASFAENRPAAPVPTSTAEHAAKALSGTGAGIVSTMLCSPLDVAKTRIQVQSSAQSSAKYSGIFQSLMTIYREEGVRGWCERAPPARDAARARATARARAQPTRAARALSTYQTNQTYQTHLT